MKVKGKVLVVMLAILIIALPFASIAPSVDAAAPITYNITIKSGGHGSDTSYDDVTSGTSFYDIFYRIPEPEAVEGYYYFGFSTKPVSEYSTKDELLDDMQELYNDTRVQSDMTIYRIWLTVIDEVKLLVEPPKCGMSTSTSDYDAASGVVYGWENQTNKPVLKFENPEMFETTYESCWTKEMEYRFYPWFPYEGDFIAGTEYGVGFKDIVSKFPYVITTDTVFYINDKKITDSEDLDIQTCYPNDCWAYELSNARVLGKVTGTHDWDEWDIIEQPTEDEPGLQRRVCRAFPATHFEEEPISPLGRPVEKNYYFIEEAGATYVLNSGTTLDFTVKANVNDEDTFRLFEGIEIDGKSVDKSAYTAAAGSVNLSLYADYLDTLPEGAHSIKAVFNDGDAQTRFVITRDNETESDPDDYDNADDDIDEDDMDDEDEDDSAQNENTSSDTVSTLPTGSSLLDSMWLFFLIICSIMFSIAAVTGKRYVAKYMRK